MLPWGFKFLPTKGRRLYLDPISTNETDQKLKRQLNVCVCVYSATTLQFVFVCPTDFQYLIDMLLINITVLYLERIEKR